MPACPRNSRNHCGRWARIGALEGGGRDAFTVIERTSVRVRPMPVRMAITASGAAETPAKATIGATLFRLTGAVLMALSALGVATLALPLFFAGFDAAYGLFATFIGVVFFAIGSII
jgi:hypothetical protein